MKVFINKIWLLLAISIFVGSCEEEDLTVLNPNASTTVSLSSDDVVLTENNVGMDVLDVTWTQPDYGYNAAAEYEILFDLASGDFSSPQAVDGGNSFSKTFKTEELNKILINLGAEPETKTELAVKVELKLSNEYKKVSEPESLMATAYSSTLDLTTLWGVVGSATTNGWDGPDMPFYKSETPGVNVAYVTLADGEWKIRQDNKWDLNYGDTGLDGSLEEGGDNIPVDAGTYKILFDENALTYTIEKYAWGLVGSATTNGWDGPDMPLSYDSCSDTWRAVVTLGEGEWKFRKNNDWSVNYGDTGLDGNLEDGGDNIPVEAGTYQVIVDFNDLTYTIEKTDVWGIVGSGYNDWGATPDAVFTPDYCNEGIFYINGVTLLDGEIKFRLNSDWGVNYGDTGLDGILDDGGDNIPSTAGVYDVVLDFTNPSVPTYTMTAK